MRECESGHKFEEWDDRPTEHLICSVCGKTQEDVFWEENKSLRQELKEAREALTEAVKSANDRSYEAELDAISKSPTGEKGGVGVSEQ